MDPREALLRLETLLLRPHVRRSRERLEELLAPGFLEFGASGRVFTREEIVEALPNEPHTERLIVDFAARELAPGLVLVTYRAERPGGASSLRSSIWRETGGRWELMFHQGTAIPG